MARHFKLGRFFEGTAISIRLRHIVQHRFAPPLLLPRFLAIFRPPRWRHTLSHFAAIMTIDRQSSSLWLTTGNGPSMWLGSTAKPTSNHDSINPRRKHS